MIRSFINGTKRNIYEKRKYRRLFKRSKVEKLKAGYL